MRTAWLSWITALTLVSTFTGSVIVCLDDMGWYGDAAEIGRFGVRPPAFAWNDVAVAVALFVASHVVPRLLPARRTQRRVGVELGEDAGYRTAPSRVIRIANEDALRAAANARRATGLALSLALSLAIAFFGFALQSRCFHGPIQHPNEWLAYFVACALAVVTHVPLRAVR